MKCNNNYNWLGTCRGLAVIGVILTHFLPQVDDAWQLNTKLISAITVDYIDTGKIGVALLFMIAGFLAPSSKKKRNTKQFLINRFFRLYPVYWVAIFLVGILFAFDGYGLDTILANLTMIQVFLGKEDLVGVFWTLPIELTIYLGAIVFEKWMWEYSKIKWLFWVFCVGSIGMAIIRKYFWLKAPVAIFLLISIALLGQLFKMYKSDMVKKNEVIISVAIFETCILISSFLAYQVDVGYHENWHRYFFSYSIAILTFFVFMYSEKKSLLLSMIAEIAYPLYLLQEIVFRVSFRTIWFDGINPFGFITGTIMTLVGGSIAVHLLIEKYCIRIGYKLEKNRNNN